MSLPLHDHVALAAIAGLRKEAREFRRAALRTADRELSAKLFTRAHRLDDSTVEFEDALDLATA